MKDFGNFAIFYFAKNQRKTKFFNIFLNFATFYLLQIFQHLYKKGKFSNIFMQKKMNIFCYFLRRKRRNKINFLFLFAFEKWNWIYHLNDKEIM